MSKFKVGDPTRIMGGEVGEIVGVTEYPNHETVCLVRYSVGEASAEFEPEVVERTYPESMLARVEDSPCSRA